MRFKMFQMINTPIGDFGMFLGESKKRQYIMTWDKNGNIMGFKKYNKEKGEGYFLIYDEEEIK